MNCGRPVKKHPGWSSVLERVAVLERKILALSPTPEDVCRSLSTARLGQILRAEMPEEEARELCRITRRPLEDLRGPAYDHLLTRAQKENPEAYEQVVELVANSWRSQYEGTFTFQKAYETHMQVCTLLAPPDGGTEAATPEVLGVRKGNSEPIEADRPAEQHSARKALPPS